jgi:hypothetical protein
LLYIVAQTARAELAEISEVLAQLRRLHSCDFRERFTGYRVNVVGFQTLQAAQVNGQAIDGFARDFGAVRLFQCAGELLQSDCAIKRASVVLARFEFELRKSGIEKEIFLSS